ncbi:hypothetical protein PT2222_70142 [Paraburkholderia tropica]
MLQPRIRHVQPSSRHRRDVSVCWSGRESDCRYIIAGAS